MKLKISYFFFFTCIIAATKGEAQDPRQIPGLLEDLKKQTSDTGRIQTYSLLCFHYTMVNTDTALIYGEKGLQLAEKIRNEKGKADVSNSMGWAYLQRNDYYRAEPFFISALNYWKKENKKTEQKRVMANLGVLHMNKADFPKSFEYMSEVLKLDDETHDNESKAVDLFSVGRLYNMQKNYLEARKYFQQAYEAHKQNGNELLMSEVVMSIGNTYQYEGKYAESIKYYDQVIPVFQKFKNAKRLGLAYENKAGSYAAIKDYPSALKYYDLAEEQYKSLDSKVDIYYIHSGKGEVYLEAGEATNALLQLQTALRYANDMNDRNLQYDVMKRIAEIYTQKGDYKKAWQMLAESDKIKDSIFTLEKQNELLRVQTQFETEKKEKENILLKARNETAVANLQRSRFFLFAALTGLLFLGGIIYLVYKNKEGKARHIKTLEQLNAQLQQQKEEIGRMNTILQLKNLRAQMNPHFIFNCMSSIQECILLGQLDDANRYLTKLSKLLRMVLLYADEESISLDKELQMLDLYLQLESVRLKQNFEYKIEVGENVYPEEIHVPTLLLQPFAENAIWHGLQHKEDNRKILIKITADENLLYCIVEDNGVGRTKASQLMQLKKNHQSKGLKIVRDRLQILQQKSSRSETGFKIIDLVNETNQPIGTRVQIILPIAG